MKSQTLVERVGGAATRWMTAGFIAPKIEPGSRSNGWRGRLKLKASRGPNPLALKTAWIEMSDEAEGKMIRVADERPDLPIGVAFVDAAGRPGWIGDDPLLRLHAPSVRGCWPVVHGLEP